ncbi:unnamed protein product [Prunus armeniaca]
MAINQSNFQQTTQAAISKLEVQLGQIAAEIAQREPGKWLSQSVINPKNQEAKAVHVLISGKIVDNKFGSNLSNDAMVVEDEDEKETIATKGEQPKTSQSAPKAKSDSQEPNPFQLHKGETNSCHHFFKEIDTCHPLHMFHRFHFLAIPAYGKFIKNLKTHKLNFAPNEETKLNNNVSVVLQRKLPPKLEDPGSFDIPINIGDKKVARAMLDLGASINVMPYPKVMDMEDNPYGDRVDPILLGRPFMATIDTIIKVRDGTLSLTVLGETVSECGSPVLHLLANRFRGCTLNTHKNCVLGKKSNDALEAILTQEEEDLYGPEFQEVVVALAVFQPYPPSFRPPLEPLGPSSTKLESSIITPPKLEPKPLPNHLKYTYLGANETLPVIIAIGLTSYEEDSSIEVLKEHKTGLGWTIADIKRISPSMCMHRILMEEDSKPSHSKWVSPVQVVPKKSRITVVKNEKNELVPIRTIIGWRVGIDYRKLNTSTRKDHFPLPFIDQMLDRLSGHAYYCFLDGFSGYNQIPIAPED